MKLACNVEMSEGFKSEMMCGYLIQVMNAHLAVVVDFKGELHFVDPRNVTVLKREVFL